MPIHRLSQTERAHEQASNDIHYHHERAIKELGALFEACKFLGHNHQSLIGHLHDLVSDTELTDVDQY